MDDRSRPVWQVTVAVSSRCTDWHAPSGSWIGHPLELRGLKRAGGMSVLDWRVSSRPHPSLLILARRNGVHIGDTEEMGIRGNQDIGLFSQTCCEIQPIVVGKRVTLGV